MRKKQRRAAARRQLAFTLSPDTAQRRRLHGARRALSKCRRQGTPSAATVARLTALVHQLAQSVPRSTPTNAHAAFNPAQSEPRSTSTNAYAASCSAQSEPRSTPTTAHTPMPF
jgi:hypothetical protein